MEYRDKRNLRQIGNDLRVSHVLEGSVRRIGTRFHMNAQLIDTRTDTHVWVEQYDRDLNDLFAIQSEIAQKIAGQLRAKISPAEKLAIERKPTGDLVAFELYSRAISFTPTSRRQHRRFGAAGNRSAEPGCGARSIVFRSLLRSSPCIMTSFTSLILTILLRGWRQQKQPFRKHSASVQMPAKHTSRERFIFIMDTSIMRALWLNWKLPARRCPIDPRIFRLTGSIQRRQGRWEESMRNLERALELDPRNVTRSKTSEIVTRASGVMLNKNRSFDRILAIEPNDAHSKSRARISRTELES